MTLGSYAEGERFIEKTEYQEKCKGYTGHMRNERYLKRCGKCGTLFIAGEGALENMWMRKECSHEWIDIEGDCILCGAEWSGV